MTPSTESLTGKMSSFRLSHFSDEILKGEKEHSDNALSLRRRVCVLYKLMALADLTQEA